jgi:hypothetical protein
MADEKNVSATGKVGDPPATATSADSGEKSLPSTTKLSEMTIDHLSAIIASEVRRGLERLSTPVAGVHVNSGPPGFVNGGGHANFDPKTVGGFGNVGNPAGVHVNSGPPGFVNGGGHANFDPKTAGGFGNVGNPAGVHVNSGPPGFVNGGGHANFDPKTAGGFGNLGNPAGVHVNSGPPGFVNGGGHANFDPKTQLGGLINVTLPDGGQLAIPAAGSFNMKVRGFTVQR